MEPRTTCGMSSENIQDYLDGALTPAELARFEAHAAGCKACTRELEAYRGLFVRLSRMPLVAPAPDFDRDSSPCWTNWDRRNLFLSSEARMSSGSDRDDESLSAWNLDNQPHRERIN